MNEKRQVQGPDKSGSLSFPDVSGELLEDKAGDPPTTLGHALPSVASIRQDGAKEFQRDNVQEVIEGKTSFDKVAYFDPYTGVSWRRYLKMDVHGDTQPIKRVVLNNERNLKPERELPELFVARKEDISIYYYAHGKLYAKDAKIVGDFGFDLSQALASGENFIQGVGTLRRHDGSLVQYHGRATSLGNSLALIALGPPAGTGMVFLPLSAEGDAILGCPHQVIHVPLTKVFSFCKEHGLEPFTGYSEEFARELPIADDGYAYFVDRRNCRLRMQRVNVNQQVSRYVFERYVRYSLTWFENSVEQSRVIEEWIADPSVRINYS